MIQFFSLKFQFLELYGKRKIIFLLQSISFTFFLLEKLIDGGIRWPKDFNTFNCFQFKFDLTKDFVCLLQLIPVQLKLSKIKLKHNFCYTFCVITAKIWKKLYLVYNPFHNYFFCFVRKLLPKLICWIFKMCYSIKYGLNGSFFHFLWFYFSAMKVFELFYWGLFLFLWGNNGLKMLRWKCRVANWIRIFAKYFWTKKIFF